MQIANGHFWQGDCLDLMRDIPSGSVDMVLCDLPYGTTACSWDSIIPFEPLWEQYWRVCKPNAAIVLTASQPFTSVLVGSQIDRFKYEWIWNKVLPTGFAIAKFQPMKQHESVLVFGKSKTTYNAQTTPRDKPRRYNRTHTNYEGSENLKSHDGSERVLSDYQPRSLLEFSNANQRDKIHPTQKPVALFEYLIKTYTNPGELVLDNTAGSGTTAVASERTGRRWICIERDEEYYLQACARVLDL